MLYALLLGFLIGMIHALEADHLAAIASFSVRKNSLRDTLKLGYSWGVGHTVTLFLMVVPVYLFGGAISLLTEAGLELLVGVMLVYLGANIIYRLRRDRVHLHVHSHADEIRHIHVHSHKDDTTRDNSSSHDHSHRPRISGRAFGIGLVHGLAGSAALLVYAQGAILQPWVIIPYVLLFGAGSILGMTLISKAISIPIQFAVAHSNISFEGLKVAVSALTIALGLSLAWSSAQTILFLSAV